MVRTHGAGAAPEKEGDMQSPVRATDEKTAPG